MHESEFRAFFEAWLPIVSRWASSSAESRRATRELAALLMALAAEPEAKPQEQPPPLPQAFPSAINGTQAGQPAQPHADAAEAKHGATILAAAGLFTPAPAQVHGPRLNPVHVKKMLEEGLARGQTTQLPPIPHPAMGTWRPSHTHAEVAGTSGPLDFSKMERRCRLKADGCEVAIERQRLISAGESIEPAQRKAIDLFERTKEVAPCMLWMLRDGTEAWDDVVVDRARRWYLNTAAAVALAREHLETHAEEVLTRLAEAQSGLRSSLTEIGWEDRDVQLQVYMWLRDEARTRQIYLPNFLSVEAAADAESFSAAQDRIENARRRFDDQGKKSKEQNQALQLVKHYAKRLAKAAEDEQGGFWMKIGEGIEGFVSAGGTANARALTDALAGAIDYQLADERAPVFGDAAAEALRVAAERAADEDDDAAEKEPTREVLEAREALAGKSVVLVGGVHKANAAESIKRAFDLRELYWISNGEHASLSRFEPAVARADTALVVMMVRWSSHSYEQLRELCKKHGKMYVRLTGGYSPAQIAHRFLAQNSERLAAG